MTVDRKIEKALNIKTRKKLCEELHRDLQSVRVEHMGVKVTAYIKDGVIGKVSPKSRVFHPIDKYGIRKNGEHFYLTTFIMEERNYITTQYRNTNPEQHLIASVKNRAKRTGLEFNLTKLEMPELCPILGIKLNYSYGGGKKEDKATIDRVDNSKGYTEDNVVVCSWRANRLKNDASLEEIEKIYKYVTKHQRKK
jgi:hypothetical protein